MGKMFSRNVVIINPSILSKQSLSTLLFQSLLTHGVRIKDCFRAGNYYSRKKGTREGRQLIQSDLHFPTCLLAACEPRGCEIREEAGAVKEGSWSGGGGGERGWWLKIMGQVGWEGSERAHRQGPGRKERVHPNGIARESLTKGLC